MLNDNGILFPPPKPKQSAINSQAIIQSNSPTTPTKTPKWQRLRSQIHLQPQMKNRSARITLTPVAPPGHMSNLESRSQSLSSAVPRSCCHYLSRTVSIDPSLPAHLVSDRDSAHLDAGEPDLPSSPDEREALASPCEGGRGSCPWWSAGIRYKRLWNWWMIYGGMMRYKLRYGRRLKEIECGGLWVTGESFRSEGTGGAEMLWGDELLLHQTRESTKERGDDDWSLHCLKDREDLKNICDSCILNNRCKLQLTRRKYRPPRLRWHFPKISLEQANRYDCW